MTFVRTKTQYFTPTTGSTVTLANANADVRVFLNPAGSLLALTVEMPTNPFNGQSCVISSSNAITSLTLSVAGGVTILSALTSMTANAFGGWTWCSNPNTWFRTG